MTGWDQNADPDCFLQADLADAARALADVLDEENADVLTAYDWHGNYGHPDHIKVHQVGHAAADLVPSVRLFEATMNRDAVIAMMQRMQDAGAPSTRPGDDDEPFDPTGPADDGNPFGMPESELTLHVDVGAFVAQKRAAIAAHNSQISDQSFFLEMPDEAFAAMFGSEWYIERGIEPPMRTGWFFD